jgi:hypothetical protein
MLLLRCRFLWQDGPPLGEHNMPNDARDELWSAAFDTLYDSAYAQALADKLIDRWQQIDLATRLLVAFTTSGSAIAGWAVWSTQGFHAAWLILSAVAAILSIIHATLAVPTQIKDHAEDKRRFLGLKEDLETFRYEMRINPEFDIKEFQAKFNDFRKRYSDAAQLVKSDIILGKGMEKQAQDQVNRSFAREIEK